VDAGFQQDGVLIAEVDFQRMKIPSERRVAFKRELIDRLGATPGVESAADVQLLPLDGNSSSNEVWIDGMAIRQKGTSHFNHVSAGYFKTLGVPLLAGRDFDQRDSPASPKVAVVNEAFARRFTDGANPVGKIFRREATPSDPEIAFQIIGLVKNTKYLNLREDFGPIAFLATSQDTRPGSWDRVVIRSHAPLPDLVSRVKQTIGDVSPQIVFNFETYKAKIGKGLMRERLMAALSGFFGLLAGLLAIIGLYGVMAYVVAQRRNEIGIRMALGADRRGILNLILREAGMLLVIGLGVGTALALGAARPAKSMLFGLKPYDPVTLILAIVGLALVAVVASYVPARRAAGLDPMAALREE
jgi:putative ABC transport system permease protein